MTNRLKGVTRQVRGVSLSIARRDYVLAARALGATDQRIMLRHVLPNVSSIVRRSRAYAPRSYHPTATMLPKIARSSRGLAASTSLQPLGPYVSSTYERACVKVIPLVIAKALFPVLSPISSAKGRRLDESAMS